MSRRKTEIISDVSHEFRTPLTTILGYAELIRDETLEPAEIHEFAGDIVRDVERLTRMMENVLDLERLEAGASRINITTIDLVDLISEEVTRWKSDDDTKHQITVVADHGLPTVSADHDRILQVVSNLLGNAVKYSPDGGEITISLTANPGASEFRVEVQDHGIGIGPDSHGRIFERFARTAEAIRHGIRGPGWVLRSVGRSSRAMAVGSVLKARSARVRPSGSPCPPIARDRSSRNPSDVTTCRAVHGRMVPAISWRRWSGVRGTP